MICIPITAAKTDEALAMMERADALADLIELRVDRMRDVKLERLLAVRRTPVIVTNRRREEGGDFAGTEAERTDLLAEAARLGADYIDIEMGTAPVLKEELRRICSLTGTKRIASWHDFFGTPSTDILRGKLAEGMADVPAIVKMVTHAVDEADCLRLLQMIPNARRKGQAVIAFCMGNRGKFSRIMAPLIGSLISYAPLELEGASAPGQLTACRMREIFRCLYDDLPTWEECPSHTGLPVDGSGKAEEK